MSKTITIIVCSLWHVSLSDYNWLWYVYKLTILMNKTILSSLKQEFPNSVFSMSNLRPLEYSADGFEWACLFSSDRSKNCEMKFVLRESRW